MDIHVRNVGILNIVLGIVSAAAGFGCLIYFGGISNLYDRTYLPEAAGLAAAWVILQTLIAAPCALAGWFVLKYHDWARSATIILSALNMLNVPFGTIVGGYSLWVLFTPETEPLFSDPRILARRNPPARKKPPQRANATILRTPKPDIRH
jgi:hypothetical protein